VRGIHWETHVGHADLGRIPILGYDPIPGGISVKVGYYEMDGTGLARVAMQVLPGVVDKVLHEAKWTREQLDLVIAHQPNAKLLEIGSRVLGLDPATVPMPVRQLGNMGPASVIINLAIAHETGRLIAGSKILLVAFGLGFSCGAVAVEIL